MTKGDVLQLKEELEYAEKMRVNAENQLETSKRYLASQQYEFRKAEVTYVLENLQYLISHDMIDKRAVDGYLCHCQNCLNGNIDGTVLDFSKYYEKKEEKEEKDGSE